MMRLLPCASAFGYRLRDSLFTIVFLTRIFHHGGIQRARQRDGWACGMLRQGPSAPARQVVRPNTRCWDAMNTECFCSVQIGFDKNEDLPEEKTLQKRGHGEISGLSQFSQLPA
jgi:hypothetical protein